MSQLNIALVTIGGLVLILGLVSGPIRRTYISAPIVALLLGILLSPAVLGLLDVASWGKQETILEEAARLTIAIGLMGVALRIPKGYAPQHWWSLAVVLGLVMPLMWLSSGLLVYWLLGLPFWVAMLIGAVVTPTDPVVSTDIVTGELAHQNIPARLRHLISTESGLIANASEKAEEEEVQEAINRFFTLPIFVLLGLVLPWQEWLQLGWKGLLLAIAVLLLRRLPAILVLSPVMTRLKSVPDVLFMGWFGPIGVAALYYIHLSLHHTGIKDVWVVGSLIIVASIVAHGISATPLSQLYGSRIQHKNKQRPKAIVR